jgi:hypothetical protein
LTRRLLTALLAVALLLPAAAAPALAVDDYAKVCDTTYPGAEPGDNNYHAYLHKITGPLAVTYGRATVRNLKPFWACDATSNSNNIGGTMVLPVNLDGNGMLAQIGVCWFGQDGPFMFCYTPDETSTPLGKTYRFPNAETPEVGNDYAFYIAYQPSLDQWKYTIQDLTDGQSWSVYGYTSAVNGAYGIWTGFETHNSNDVLAGAGQTQRIADIGYKFANDPDMTMFGANHDTFYQCCGTKMSYWRANSGLNTTWAYIQAWTVAH